MIDFLSGALVLILRAIGFVLDIARFFTDSQRLARWATGSDKLVDVPPDPKPLPPAAQRALADAEERERARGHSAGSQASQAASGAVQAS